MSLVVGPTTTLTEVLAELETLNARATLIREMDQFDTDEYSETHGRIDELLAHLKVMR